MIFDLIICVPCSTVQGPQLESYKLKRDLKRTSNKFDSSLHSRAKRWGGSVGARGPVRLNALMYHRIISSIPDDLGSWFRSKPLRSSRFLVLCSTFGGTLPPTRFLDASTRFPSPSLCSLCACLETRPRGKMLCTTIHRISESPTPASGSLGPGERDGCAEQGGGVDLCRPLSVGIEKTVSMIFLRVKVK